MRGQDDRGVTVGQRKAALYMQTKEGSGSEEPWGPCHHGERSQQGSHGAPASDNMTDGVTAVTACLVPSVLGIVLPN